MSGKTKRGAALLLASFCLLAGLSGCSGREKPAQMPLSMEDYNASITKNISTDFGSRIDNPRTFGVTQEGFLWTYGPAREDADGQTYWIDCVNTDGVRQKETRLQLPEENAGSRGTARDLGAVFYLPGQEAPYALLQEQPLEKETGFPVSGGTLTLCTPQQDGALVRVAVLNLPEILAEDAQLTLMPGIAFAVGKDSFCFGVSTGSKSETGQPETWLVRCALDGSCLAAVSLQAWVLQVQPYAANEAWFLAAEETGSALYTVKKLNTAKPEVSRCEKLSLPTAAMAFPCVGTAQVSAKPLALTADGLWQCSLKKQTAEQQLCFTDYPINTIGVKYAMEADEQNILVVRYEETEKKLQLLALNRSLEDPAAGRTVITVACDYDSASLAQDDQPLRSMAYDYNLSQSQVFVRVVDYSNTAAQEAGFSSGQAMLERDILHNTAPDILLSSSALNVQALIPKGYFIDLYPYLDADDELSREDFLPNLLALTEKDGTLPTVLTSFTLVAMAGDPQVLGEETTWNWDAFEAVRAAAPHAVISYNVRRENFLFWQLQCGGFVNYQNNTCCLDTPPFARVLQECMAFSPDPEWEKADALHAKTVFAAQEALVKLYPIDHFRNLLSVRYDLNDRYVLKGFPTDSGSGVLVMGDQQWGITRYCPDPQAAWGFFRLLLGKDYQSNDLRCKLPVRRDALLEKAQAAQQRQSAPYQMPGELSAASLSGEELEFWLNGPTEQDTQRLISFVEKADTLYVWDDAVPDIVREEFAAFQEGSHTAEEAAARMQRRVQLCLSERS